MTITTTAQLIAAVKGAVAGAVIALAPGQYTLDLYKSATPVTITSAVPATPAVFTEINIQASSGITLTGVVLDASTTPIGPWGGEATIPFQVGAGSSNITFDNLKVHGDPAWTWRNARSGMMVRQCSICTVRNVEFSGLYNALNYLDSPGLTISGVTCHDNADDCIRGGGSSNIQIINTHCWSNHPDPLDPDHPDCVQMWMANETVATHDVLIAATRYERGTGGATQGVFVRDETGHLPYVNLTVRDSVIQGAQYNAVSVNGATAPAIYNNRICQIGDVQAWLIVRATTGARLANNTAPRFVFGSVGADAATGTTEEHDVINPAPCPAACF